MPIQPLPRDLEVGQLRTTVADLQLRMAALEAHAAARSFPVRALNSDFIVSTTRDARVSYTVELTAASVGSSSDDAKATLLINGSTVSSAARNSVTATVLGIVTVNISLVQQKIISGLVLAGETVQIATSGSGVVTLVQAVEVLL